MKCPVCDKDSTVGPFKKWSFESYDVSRYDCPDCGQKYNVYRQGDKIKYTIPKSRN